MSKLARVRIYAAVSALGVAYVIGLIIATPIYTYADGMTFDNYESARDSIEQQVMSQYPDPTAFQDSLQREPVSIELTRAQAMGVVGISDAMSIRVNMYANGRSHSQLIAFLSTTILFMVSYNLAKKTKKESIAVATEDKC